MNMLHLHGMCGKPGSQKEKAMENHAKTVTEITVGSTVKVMRAGKGWKGETCIVTSHKQSTNKWTVKRPDGNTKDLALSSLELVVE